MKTDTNKHEVQPQQTQARTNFLCSFSDYLRTSRSGQTSSAISCHNNLK